jgi:hypothetical protein
MTASFHLANILFRTNAASMSYWGKLSISAQRGKLKPKEVDWKLPGSDGPPVLTRTRHGGSGRPNLDRFVEVEDSSASEAEAEAEQLDEAEAPEEAAAVEDIDVQEEVLDDGNDDEESDDDDCKKPSATRVIVEVDPLIELIENNCRCPDCEGKLKASLRTVCLASSLTLSCNNEYCGYIDSMRTPATADMNLTQKTHRQDGKERMSDYAMNVLYVIGFLSCGDGGTEAGRILGLLGLPNDTTMERRSFTIIEERVFPAIEALAKDILLENLTEEVRQTVQEPNDFELWKQSMNGSLILDKSKYPKLRVSFDMGWQQRNSGNRYASLSGHAILVGAHTRKPIAFTLKCKACNFCKTFEKKRVDEAEEVPEHRCFKNHDGSSGAMEPIACLDLTIMLYRESNCAIEMICADDDSSTRALLKWSNADYMKNNKTTSPPTVPITKGPNKGKGHVRPDRGRLPADIPEPSFVADPNHRKKVLTGELIALDKGKVADKATMTRMDSTRLGKNFGYMIRTLKDMNESLYETAGSAVLEHHFDNHEHCGQWCRRRTMTEAQRHASTRYYRCKTKDAKLYKILLEKINRFVTFDRLKEVAHGMDTQVNESFNNTASWFAPKNKVYCGSCSLTNRLSIGLGINSLGITQYFQRLYKKLGIRITKNVLYCLQMKDRTRKNRLKKIKTKEKKKDRIKRKHEDLVRDEEVARKERTKQEGVYKSGLNMQDEDFQMKDSEDAQQQQPKRAKGPTTCPHCGKKGHATKRSRKCLHYIGGNKNTTATQALPQQDIDDIDGILLDPADDTDAMDQMPLVYDPNLRDAESDTEAFNAFLASLANEDEDDEVAILRSTI